MSAVHQVWTLREPSKYSQAVCVDWQAGDWCGCKRVGWMCSTVRPEEVRKHGLLCISPPDLQLRRASTWHNSQDHVRAATSGSRAKTCHTHPLSFHHKDKRKAHGEAFKREKYPHLILSLNAVRAPGSTAEVHPRSLLHWCGDLVSVLAPAWRIPLGKTQKNPLQAWLSHFVFQKKLHSPFGRYIYDYYLSINTSVSIVRVRCPASGLTRQWTLAFLKNTVIQPL